MYKGFATGNYYSNSIPCVRYIPWTTTQIFVRSILMLKEGNRPRVQVATALGLHSQDPRAHLSHNWKNISP